MDFKDKVCVITGGGSGIGAASARAFVARGAKVALIDINKPQVEGVAEAIDALPLLANVGSQHEINEAIEATEAHFGVVDLFFNNAAIATGSDPISTPIPVWLEQWNVNVMAHVFAIQNLLPKMLERGSGYFVHTSSMAGILTTHGNITYAATKHAVVAIAEWLAITYHAAGIRTSLLAPLGVNTPMLGDRNSAFSQNAAGTIREPEEVAQMVVEAVEAESFLILTDEIAQIWMDRKNSDIERWLNGMRRLGAKIEDAKMKGYE